jgi:hypothetical protein
MTLDDILADTKARAAKGADDRFAWHLANGPIPS